jgi:hypothetical protein
MNNHYNQKLKKMKAGSQKLLTFAFVVWFSILGSGLATLASVPESLSKKYYDAECITLGGEGSVFVFVNGDHIVITAGKSIRLLPGISIEAGAQLKAEVSVTAPVITPEEEVRVSIMDNPEFLIAGIEQDYASINDSPVSENISAGHSSNQAVMPAPYSAISLTGALKKKSNPLVDDGYTIGKFSLTYIPVSSWGSCPENIKVLRT